VTSAYSTRSCAPASVIDDWSWSAVRTRYQT